MTPRQAAAAAGRKREATSRGPNFSEAMRAAREPLRKSDDKSETFWLPMLPKNRRNRLFRREHSIGIDLYRDGGRCGTTKYERERERGESI